MQPGIQRTPGVPGEPPTGVRHARADAAEDPKRRVLVITQRGATAAAVQDAAAAAQVHADVLQGWPDGTEGPRPLALLIGIDSADALLQRGAPVAVPLLLVGDDDAAAELWRAAGRVGAVAAVPLPSAGAWLVQWLIERSAPSRPAGQAVVAAVFAASGGAGASTLTAALAVQASAAGASTMVIDADPGPAGIELLLSDGGPDWPAPEQAAWPRFAGSRGLLPPDLLADLPRIEGISCLGWAGAPPHTGGLDDWRGALWSVCAAAVLAHRLILVDCGRDPALAAALPATARPIMVARGSVRGIVAGRALAALLDGAFASEPVVLVRDGGGLRTPAQCDHELGRSSIWWADDQHLAVDEECGRPPGSRSRSPTARSSRSVLARLGQGRAA